MKIVMVMKWDGVTPGQYEEVRKLANWEGNHPKGGVLHVAAFDSNGLRVTDIWESLEEFNTFAEERLMPATAQVGAVGEPHVEIFPVHAIFNPALQALS